MLDNSKLLKKEEMDQAVSNGSPTAIQAVFGYIWFYIIGSAVLFLFISPMISRKRPDDTTGISDLKDKSNNSQS